MSELYYLVSDYFATGEGRCISMMICRPEFEKEDYVSKPKWYVDQNNNWVFEEGVLKEGITEKVVLAREFVKEYDHWYGRGLEFLSRDEFFERFSSFVPEFVKSITDPNKGRIPYFKWKQQLYFNFS